MKKIEDTFSALWHYNKWFNRHIIEVWEEGEKTCRKIFEEIMTKGDKKNYEVYQNMAPNLANSKTEN